MNPIHVPTMIDIDQYISLNLLTEKDVQTYFQLIMQNRDFFLRSQAAIGDLTNSDECRLSVASRVREYETGGGISYKIMLSNEFIGIIAIRAINWRHRKGNIGYFLAEKETNKGILTKCLKRVINIGFVNFNLNRLVAHTSTKNIASNKLLQNAGFIKEGCLRQDFIVDGELVDDNAYAILRSEWRG